MIIWFQTSNLLGISERFVLLYSYHKGQFLYHPVRHFLLWLNVRLNSNKQLGAPCSFHSLLRWKMIILLILTTSLIHFSSRGRESECNFLILGMNGLNSQPSLCFSWRDIWDWFFPRNGLHRLSRSWCPGRAHRKSYARVHRARRERARGRGVWGIPGEAPKGLCQSCRQDRTWSPQGYLQAELEVNRLRPNFTAEMRFAALRSPRFGVSGYKMTNSRQFWKLVYTFVKRPQDFSKKPNTWVNAFLQHTCLKKSDLWYNNLTLGVSYDNPGSSFCVV